MVVLVGLITQTVTRDDCCLSVAGEPLDGRGGLDLRRPLRALPRPLRQPRLRHRLPHVRATARNTLRPYPSLIAGRCTCGSATFQWHLISSFYDYLPWARDGVAVANEPWSGEPQRPHSSAVCVSPSIRLKSQTLDDFVGRSLRDHVADLVRKPFPIPFTQDFDKENVSTRSLAHTTQFASPGWRMLSHDAGVSLLASGGSIVTRISPDDHEGGVLCCGVEWLWGGCAV